MWFYWTTDNFGLKAKRDSDCHPEQWRYQLSVLNVRSKRLFLMLVFVAMKNISSGAQNSICGFVTRNISWKHSAMAALISDQNYPHVTSSKVNEVLNLAIFKQLRHGWMPLWLSRGSLKGALLIPIYRVSGIGRRWRRLPTCFFMFSSLSRLALIWLVLTNEHCVLTLPNVFLVKWHIRKQ